MQIKSFKKNFETLFIVLFFMIFSCKKHNEKDGFSRKIVEVDPPTSPLSPEESIKKIQLPPGFHIELVASEPMVQEPVALCWDGNGRMYVAEMNTYMKDANATGELEPTSRIKLLEDTNGDGKMDKSTIFIDKLLLPRTVLSVGNQLIVTVTNDQNIYSYEDTNNDGKADKMEIIYKNEAVDVRNLEHQNGGFYWNLDNWIYPSRDNLRYKLKKGKLISETMVDNMIGQWGMTADNYGRLFYSEAGPGLPAVQIQQMPAYGSLNFRDQYSADFTKPWPIIGNLDAQGGPEVLRKEDNTLKEFTSGCGQSIFRGDRLPKDMQGDYFIAEPVGRVIKRGKVLNKNGKIFIEDAYKQKDWLASADMNFRPINTYTGPDGCFYIVDMYHGIIQESEWTKPDSYVGKIIVKKGLDKNIGRGRIYRVVHDEFKPNHTKPNMLNEPTVKLATYLNHPNGWWRDMAQQTIIARNDISIVPILQEIALGEKGNLKVNPTELAQIHALWTLEGLESIDINILQKALNAKSAQIRKTAIWIAELYLKNNNTDILTHLEKLKNDPSPDVKIQLSLSLRSYKSAHSNRILQELIGKNKNNEMMQFSYATFLEAQKTREIEEKHTKNLSPAHRELVENGAKIYKQLCINCHGEAGKGIKTNSKELPAPILAGSPRVKGDKTLAIELVMLGLKGPVDGKNYPNTMPALYDNDDKYIASVLSYIRNSAEIGNNASIITEKEVKEVRANWPKKLDFVPDMVMYEIMKLGRAERKNWDKK